MTYYPCVIKLIENVVTPKVTSSCMSCSPLTINCMQYKCTFCRRASVVCRRFPYSLSSIFIQSIVDQSTYMVNNSLLFKMVFKIQYRQSNLWMQKPFSMNTVTWGTGQYKYTNYFLVSLHVGAALARPKSFRYFRHSVERAIDCIMQLACQ